jgi:hypothetical protein
MSEESIPIPNTVKFVSQGVECIAFETMGIYGLNMCSCAINFGKIKPKTEIQLLGEHYRVRLEDGLVWFDTDGKTAGAIADLFK